MENLNNYREHVVFVKLGDVGKYASKAFAKIRDNEIIFEKMSLKMMK